jgi:uncharacterized membrane protein
VVTYCRRGIAGKPIHGAFTRKGMAGIGIGAWLGTIMLFNAWVLTGPTNRRSWNEAATDEEKQGASRCLLTPEPT